jgi:hypothetical protein
MHMSSVRTGLPCEALLWNLLLQDDLYTILPILSITELVIILIYLGHISGCFFYLLSTPPWQTKRKQVHCHMHAFMCLVCCRSSLSVTARSCVACLCTVQLQHSHGSCSIVIFNCFNCDLNCV